jgi:hypothetical protein
MVSREELDSIPDGISPVRLSEHDIALVVEYFPKKNKEALARKFGISPNVLRRIYNENKA